MTATATVLAAALVPIRREGARPGAMHAAELDRDAAGWRTACGELLHDSPRGRIVRLPLLEAWDLIDGDSPLLCRRCARVGDAIGGTR